MYFIWVEIFADQIYQYKNKKINCTFYVQDRCKVWKSWEGGGGGGHPVLKLILHCHLGLL